MKRRKIEIEPKPVTKRHGEKREKQIKEVTRDHPLSILVLCPEGKVTSKNWIDYFSEYLSQQKDLFKLKNSGLLCPSKIESFDGDMVISLFGPVKTARDVPIINGPDEREIAQQSLDLIKENFSGPGKIYTVNSAGDFSKFIRFLKKFYSFPDEFYTAEFNEDWEEF